MKILDKEYEEISATEYWNTPVENRIQIINNNKVTSFREVKPAPEFPIIFADSMRRIQVYANGDIEIFNQMDETKNIYFRHSLSLLYKAIEESKKIKEKRK